MRTSWMSVALPILAAAACGSSTTTVQGTATVPGASIGSRLLISAQSLKGEDLGTAVTRADGSFTLEYKDAGGSPVVLMAILPEDPERRAYALIAAGASSAAPVASTPDAVTADDVFDPWHDDNTVIVTSPLSSVVSAADAGAAAGQAIDARTTAELLVRGAVGNLGLTSAELRQRYGTYVDQAEAAIKSGALSSCTPSDADPGAPQLRAAIQGAADVPAAKPQLMDRLQQIAGMSGTFEERLRGMQIAISNAITSINNKAWPAYLNAPIGLVPVVYTRMLIWANTGQTINEITETPFSRSELVKTAAAISLVGWGNCREKAFMAAYGASLLPEVKQVAVLGLDFGPNHGSHAVAVACLDGPEVWDVMKWGTTYTAKAPPPGVRCYAIDPWAGPYGDPTAGNTGLLDAAYVEKWGWNLVLYNKQVELGGSSGSWLRAPLTLGPGGGFQATCGESEVDACRPFVLPTEPSPDVIETPDASGGDVADPGQDTGPVCPEYKPDGKGCGAAIDGCIEGFYCSMGTIACEQSVCPEGSGRTYTEECCCNCWDDQSKVNVYDPCRPGFLLRCDPRT